MANVQEIRVSKPVTTDEQVKLIRQFARNVKEWATTDQISEVYGLLRSQGFEWVDTRVPARNTFTAKMKQLSAVVGKRTPEQIAADLAELAAFRAAKEAAETVDTTEEEDEEN